MKKLVAVVLALMLFVVVNACAEPAVDFSEYTLDELILLHEALLNELDQKGYAKSAILDVGQYKIGVDLPAGSYTIELSETADPDRFGYFNYAIYDENGVDLEDDLFCKPAIKITLGDGQTLEIERSPVRITAYKLIWK